MNQIFLKTNFDKHSLSIEAKKVQSRNIQISQSQQLRARRKSSVVGINNSSLVEKKYGLDLKDTNDKGDEFRRKKQKSNDMNVSLLARSKVIQQDGYKKRQDLFMKNLKKK